MTAELPLTRCHDSNRIQPHGRNSRTADPHVVGDGGRGAVAGMDAERVAHQTAFDRAAAGRQRARIHQPKLPPAWWRVTEWNPGKGFTWVSVAPGVRVVAGHWIEPTTTGCRVTLSIRYEGLFGLWLARWTRDLNERYLGLEANGLKARCVAVAAEPFSLKS